MSFTRPIVLTPAFASARRSEPVTVGIPLPRGVCPEPGDLALADASGVLQPLQTSALERWSDGTVRWALLDFQADVAASAPARYALHTVGERPPHVAPLRVEQAGDQVSVGTGGFVLTFEPGARLPITRVQVDGMEVLEPSASGLTVEGERGVFATSFDRIEIETAGPLRTVVRAEGSANASTGESLRLTLRVELVAGHPVARLRLVAHNPKRAQHPGNFWELGDGSSVLLRRIALVLAPASGEVTEARWSLSRGDGMAPSAMPFLVHQESSGAVNWQSAVHVDAHGRVPFRYCGYRARMGDEERTGRQASPIVSCRFGSGELTVAAERFWEVFPKSYALGPTAVDVGLLPAAGAPHEIQGGERLQHAWVLAFGRDTISTPPLEWARAPVSASLTPDAYAEAQAVPYLPPRVDAGASYERLVQSGIDGGGSFFAKRDRIDEYGWRHFGDLYADHENGPPSDRPPIVSHYNNQYDALAGLIVQFMRSGDVRWWTLANDLARHVVHIDMYWTDEDKSAYNGGLFWHTAHYTDAGRATHRSYPRAPGISGGGPSTEHNYSSGLLLHYLMTGDPLSREAVVRLARWTLDMDDGRKSPLRLLTSAPTGAGSATGSADYHGPGRGPANGIATVLDAYRLTGDGAFLAHADRLIRRCIHPADDLPARNLLDAERRWYYTVFLQALGRYLRFKDDRGEREELWHYARNCLLHYARWMAEHEYPYLDRPEILEFPNETWAAQDMRKSEVFDYASLYAVDVEERARFAERARFFFRYSTATLLDTPLHARTRPTVLMLVCGYAHLWFEAHRHTLPLIGPERSDDFGRPATFVSQWTVARRRLLAAMALAAGVALVTLAWLVL